MHGIRTRFAAAAVLSLVLSAQAFAQDCQLKSLGSLPVTFSSTGELLVPAGIEGRQLLFKFSPSSHFSVLNSDTITALSLHRSSVSITTLTYKGWPIKLRVAADLTLGTSTGRSFFAAPPIAVSKDPQVAGMLGWDILRMIDMEFDLSRGRINLFSPDHCPGKVVYWTQSAATAAVPVAAGNWAMIVPASLDGQVLPVQIDPSYTRALMEIDTAERYFGQKRTNDEASLAQPYSFKSLSFEGLTISNPQLYPYQGLPLRRDAQGSAAIYLGWPQLKQLRLYVAVKEKMIYITAANAQ